jgi:hypothetical protein
MTPRKKISQSLRKRQNILRILSVEGQYYHTLELREVSD